MNRIYLTIVFLLTLCTVALGQDSATVSLTVVDSDRKPLPGALITIKGVGVKEISDDKGKVEFKVPANEDYVVFVSYLNEFELYNLYELSPNEEFSDVIKLSYIEQLVEVNKVVDSDREFTLITIDPKDNVKFPGLNPMDVLTGGAIGLNTSNELSSAYKVRGGNFDENLVYVNDIEVYRPFLVRSGQQEGLGFVNVDMTERVKFSAGGFQSKYGDKLSSVLDVRYTKPKEFKATAEASFLGGSLHAEDFIKTKKRSLSYVIGARYRSNQYIFGAVDVQGNYKPRFIDIQSYITYDLTSRLSLEWLSAYSQNRFLLVPESRESSFGTVQNALKLFVAFGGQELMQYNTWMNGLTLAFQQDSFNQIKLISSVYTTQETEHFTVEGAYRLDQLENNLGSDDFGESRVTLGAGYFINHARNDLNAVVFSEKIMGRHVNTRNRSVLTEWGVKFQGEQITDVLREWDYNDSAGHNVSTPGYDESSVAIANFVNTEIKLNSFRVMGYFQQSRLINTKNNFRLHYGIRSNYWTLNKQNVISPRIQLSIEPNKEFNDSIKKYFFRPSKQDSLMKQDWLFRLSAGYYYQPPFYRELRNIQGEINRDLKAQRSIHVVLGGDLNFTAWTRPFKLIVEGYYKDFDQLVPYIVDDVRIRYRATNTSRGYATGIDARVNGEFIRGLESYVNLSVMQTKENITYVDEEGITRESGFIRRPTDQRVNASILFQDELKRDSTFQLQLRMIFGSDLPYYFDGRRRYVESLSIPAYRRVDIGFSKVLFDQKTSPKKEKYKNLETLWLSVEIFNMLQFNNTISYLWVKDINNNVYGVPNRLTGRRISLRVRATF